ncbi:MAG: hypothetical protein NC098_04470 [Lachnoclostridium sp.]|nr:hypothetical protein [Lachnoclostridium sp.]
MFSIAIIAVAVVLLGVKVFFVKGGRFPSGHVHDINALKNKTMHHRQEK